MKQYEKEYEGDMTAYLEHTDGVWSITDEDGTVYRMWNDEDITQHKIKMETGKIEKENGKKIDLKFRLNDMTLNELRERLNKNWESILALEEEEGELIDSYINLIESDVKKYGLRRLQGDKRSVFNTRHAYQVRERKIISQEEPWLLEGRTLIDKLFSMINQEG